MIAGLIDFFVRILTGGKYMWIDERNVKPIVVIEKMNSFDVDNMIDFAACEKRFGSSKGDEK